MLPSLREDYLEAILVHTEKHQANPTEHDIAQALHVTDEAVHSHMEELARSGDVMPDKQGEVVLTAAGEDTGRQVIKKHETLQCFLTEILGMDSSLASDEACKIEHTVSDETIDRLDVYLRSPVPQTSIDTSTRPGRSCIRGSPQQGPCSYSQSLVDFEEGDRLVVRDILGRACAKRLLDLGVVPGQAVVIKRKLGNQSVVVQVKGCDVALSPEIASAICVERLP
jgi:DtxR family transcriptional regulator, Mn-dependent transcriptional regulator